MLDLLLHIIQCVIKMKPNNYETTTRNNDNDQQLKLNVCIYNNATASVLIFTSTTYYILRLILLINTK